MEIQAFRCFGSTPDSGNLALVCHGEEAARLSVEQRQLAARELGAPACVFIAAGVETDEAATLDYYYPHARSVLCLHASLAAAGWLWRRDGRLPAVLRTAGGQRLLLEEADGRILFRLSAQPVAAAVPSREWLAGALGCDAARIVTPPALASAGSPKLLVELASQGDVESLAPDLAGIIEWGRAVGVNGCYAYARLDAGRYLGRNFNHLDPALEDAATGVAVAALSLHLRQDLILRQGEMQGNPCELSARWGGEWVSVGGACEEVL